MNMMRSKLPQRGKTMVASHFNGWLTAAEDGRAFRYATPATRRRTPKAALLILAALLLLTGCRRDLWIYTDELRQLELITDWSEATERPGGMTWWFIVDDGSGLNRRGTTADVTHSWLSLPRGTYTGIIFDYSPAEYAHQEFVGMTHPDSALLRLLPSADQPLPDDHLFGDSAVAPSMQEIPRYAATGMYVVTAEPEIMNADTLKHVNIVTGVDGDLILWDERESYEAKITHQTLNAQPKPVVWKLNITVFVKNIQYMGSVRGSVAGLTDGCWLATLRHTSTPCLQQLDSWSARATTDSIGYISTSVNTLGLPDLDMPSDTRSYEDVDYDHPNYDEHLRLNLQFLLRDNHTMLNYHFNVGSDCITIMEDQLVVRIDIPIDYEGGVPDLPYVEADNSAGFDAKVTPWADGGTADATM